MRFSSSDEHFQPVREEESKIQQAIIRWHDHNIDLEPSR
jgi:hypothetical protein